MKTIDDLEFEIPEEIEKYTAHSAEIAIMILNFILSNEGMTKKKFAALVGKTSSDITRWVSGSHNFTIQTLSLIEAKTGIQIIRNLSDNHRKKHLKGEVFNHSSEKELYRELMNKYMELIKDLQRIKAEKSNELQSNFEKINMYLMSSQNAKPYFITPSENKFSTILEQTVVQLSLGKDTKTQGYRENLNVTVKTIEK